MRKRVFTEGQRTLDVKEKPKNPRKSETPNKVLNLKKAGDFVK